MKVEKQVPYPTKIDQTDSIEPPFSRWIIEFIPVVVIILGIFTLFPTKPKQPVGSQTAPSSNQVIDFEAVANNRKPASSFAPDTNASEPISAVAKTPVNANITPNLVTHLPTKMGITSNLQRQELTARQISQIETNHALITRVYREVLSKGDLDVARELFDQPFFYYELGWPKEVRGFEAVERLVTRSRSDLTAVHYHIDKLTFDEDLVIVRWTVFVSPEKMSSQQLRWHGTTIWRVRQGKVAEAWTI